jgi:hypothetical protein
LPQIKGEIMIFFIPQVKGEIVDMIRKLEIATEAQSKEQAPK